MNPKHIIITVHGILTDKHKDNWQDRFQSYCLQYSSDVEVHSFKYGWWMILPYISTLPKWAILTRLARNFYAHKLKAFIKSKVKENPNSQLHIVAHSFGTWITHELILDPEVILETVHLIAGVISAHISRNSLDEACAKNTKEVYIYSSKHDTVCRFAPFPFGHLGYWGLIDREVVEDRNRPRHKPYPNLNLTNYPTEYGHNGYWNTDIFSQVLLDILL